MINFEQFLVLLATLLFWNTLGMAITVVCRFAEKAPTFYSDAKASLEKMAEFYSNTLASFKGKKTILVIVSILVMSASWIFFVFFDRYDYSPNTTGLKDWVDVAVYFNNILSPLFLLLTIILLLMTWSTNRKELKAMTEFQDRQLLHSQVADFCADSLTHYERLASGVSIKTLRQSVDDFNLVSKKDSILIYVGGLTSEQEKTQKSLLEVITKFESDKFAHPIIVTLYFACYCKRQSVVPKEVDSLYFFICYCILKEHQIFKQVLPDVKYLKLLCESAKKYDEKYLDIYNIVSFKLGSDYLIFIFICVLLKKAILAKKNCLSF
ncbi:hypothetical protein [Pseudoalteromonas sp. R3]|uniref:hypothetical protein n=1 Tax=Pseudoalteromonas sp. R3 TaxID=1709477 RepID=UPI000FDE80A0|nr:hypothetical protein [Pseudoalteromonas sp. R3]AZZ98249.1 hypothetical protein ELR70_14670 [Pseudoalteromonas sp. R3]